MSNNTDIQHLPAHASDDVNPEAVINAVYAYFVEVTGPYEAMRRINVALAEIELRKANPPEPVEPVAPVAPVA